MLFFRKYLNCKQVGKTSSDASAIHASAQTILEKSSNIIYEQKIYELIKENEPVSFLQLSEYLTIHPDVLANGLDQLCKCGMIKVFLVCNDIEYYVTFRWKGPKV